MNVEFQIHGVSSGQAMWKLEDQDYYKQFYSGESENVLLKVEIVRRPHGISTYYTYLRNNNILSPTRTGSYFGMTVRIDGSFCIDVKSIYLILDTLFNKMIVGRILKSVGDNFEYVVDTFSTQNDYFIQIEKQFSNMLSAFCSQKDFIDISSVNLSLGNKYCVNAFEISIPMAMEILIKQRAKLYISPTFQSESTIKEIAKAKAKADAAVADAQVKIQAAEAAHSQYKQEQAQEFETWKKEKQNLVQERDKAIRKYNELSDKVKGAELNTSINGKIAEIKQPLLQLAGLLAERFQEDSYGNIQEKPLQNKKNGKGGLWKGPSEKPLFPPKNPKKRFTAWLICALFVVAVAAIVGAVWLMSNPENTNHPVPVNDTYEKAEEHEDPRISNSVGAVEQGSKTNEVEAKETVIKYDLANLKINIAELPPDAQGLTTGKTYTCNIVGGKYPTDGYWIICDGDNNTNGNVFTVISQPGTQVKITYYHGTEVIVERKINIVKK